MMANEFDTYMFVGSFTRKLPYADGLGSGVSIYKFNVNNGEINYIKTIPEDICGQNPTALWINNKTNYVYIANLGQTQSKLTSLKLNNNFDVIKAQSYNSYGGGPCYMISDSGSNNLYVANYAEIMNPSVVVYKICSSTNDLILIAKDNIKDKGCLAIPDRQEIPHIHCIMPCKRLSDKNEFYCCDLGRDTIFHYKLSGNQLAVISSLKCDPGFGPRHISYNPTINIFYVSFEMGSKIGVVQYDYQTNKLISIVQVVNSLPNDIKNDDDGSVFTTSHLLCDKNGKYLYCANRGHDSIVCYKINSKSGLLNENTPQWFDCHGKVPRHMEIDPTNNYLISANQAGDHQNIAVFKINHQNGALDFVQCVATGSPAFIQFIQKPKSQLLQSKL